LKSSETNVRTCPSTYARRTRSDFQKRLYYSPHDVNTRATISHSAAYYASAVVYCGTRVTSPGGPVRLGRWTGFDETRARRPPPAENIKTRRLWPEKNNANHRLLAGPADVKTVVSRRRGYRILCIRVSSTFRTVRHIIWLNIRRRVFYFLSPPHVCNDEPAITYFALRGDVAKR